MKHGFLAPGEKYSRFIHNNSKTIEGRNINWETNPRSQFYSDAEIASMKSEIRRAICPICEEPIDDNITCRVCENGHKFHSRCYSDQREEMKICPICRNDDIEKCDNNFDDVFSGGKERTKRNKYTKKRKLKRKVRKSRKVRKTRR
jgi:hypothetical protein